MYQYTSIAVAIGCVGLLGWASAAAQGGAPEAFGKVAPIHNATGVSVAPTLSWSTSAGAAFYEYCLDTTNDNACSAWTGAGATSATPGGLAAGTTYYWQVRAQNAGGSTYANGGPTAFWSFTTAPSPPGAFSKLGPANGASGQSATIPVLSWGASAGVSSYEYCYDQVNDNACSTWVSAGTNTSAFLSTLAAGTTYYWHVRAHNTFGTTYANGGTYWAFTTQAGPGAFTKATPSNFTSGLPFTVTLAWNASPGANSYEYCLDTTNDNACAVWAFLGPDTSVNRFNLSAGTTYYWQVRATNPGGITYADGSPGNFWSFTTSGSPGPFGKAQPSNGQMGVPLNPAIVWESSVGNSGYEYCYDTTNDGSCTSWIGADDQFAGLSNLMPNTTYYWHVRAPTSLGVTYADGDASAFWSFTTTPVLSPPPCNVLSLLGATGHAASVSNVFPISGTTSSFTVEAWILPAQPPSTHRYQSVVSDAGYTLFVEEHLAGFLRVGVALHPDDVQDFLDGPYDNRYITLQQWHHVAFVYDDTARQGRLSLDGVLGPPIPIQNIDFAATARRLTVGAFDGGLQFNGLVDNVRISSVARYSDTFTPPDRLVSDAHTKALYQFGAPLYSTVFADESGNGHTLTAVNGAYSTLAGQCVDPAAPTATGVSPASGSTSGGTRVTVTGTGFSPGAEVSIGGSPTTAFTFNSTTSITVTTGARAAGLVNVVVTNPDSNTATLVGGFTYVAPPPLAFGKSAPSDGAVGRNTVALNWGVGMGATAYEYCIDTSNDNACTSWNSVGRTTSAVLVGLAPNTPHYWQVRAVGPGGTTYANGSAEAFWSVTTGTATSLPDFRDFNSDGRPDLVFEHASGSRYVWFMDGTTFLGGSFLSPDPMNSELAIVGANDFTGDGRSDLLTQSLVDGTVILHHMHGVLRIAMQMVQAAQNTPWRVVASGDFNGDDRPDIVWQNFTTGQIYIWSMSYSGGSATFGGVGGAFAGSFVRDAGANIVRVGETTMRVVGAADMDLDGDADLVGQDQATGALRVWYLDGQVLTSAGLISPSAVNPHWRLKVVGDYNADGRADLIFQHINGSLHAWFMNGATLASSAALSPAAVNPVWRLVGPR